MTPRKPTRAEVLAAADKLVPDVIAPDLRVLFCGINPGLYTAAVGHHFGRPGNRFWPTLFAAGFTPRLFHPSEQRELLALGFGITNVVERATATADQLTRDEIVVGGKRLVEKVLRVRPRFLAMLGLGAYRVAFARPKATTGLQPEGIGNTHVWVLPNPSGLNAHYNGLFAGQFAELREAADARRPGEGGER
ncbi:MAG: G/U mismatch-specific DNA glycosylase [Fimbriiglobus sp.]